MSLVPLVNMRKDPLNTGISPFSSPHKRTLRQIVNAPLRATGSIRDSHRAELIAKYVKPINVRKGKPETKMLHLMVASCVFAAIAIFTLTSNSGGVVPIVGYISGFATIFGIMKMSSVARHYRLKQERIDEWTSIIRQKLAQLPAETKFIEDLKKNKLIIKDKDWTCTFKQLTKADYKEIFSNRS